MKNALGILIGMALNLKIALGRMDILLMLILPVHEHGICLHLFDIHAHRTQALLSERPVQALNYRTDWFPVCKAPYSPEGCFL